jgi:hypothetical protein
VSLSNFPIPRRDGISPNRSEEETCARRLGRRPCGHRKTPTHRKRNLTPASSSSSSPFYCPSSSSSTFHRLGTHLVTLVFVRTLPVPRYLTRGHGGPAASVGTAKRKKAKAKSIARASQSSTATVPLSACFHPADLSLESEPPQRGVQGSRPLAFNSSATSPAPSHASSQDQDVAEKSNQ